MEQGWRSLRPEAAIFDAPFTPRDARLGDGRVLEVSCSYGSSAKRLDIALLCLADGEATRA